MVDDPLEIPDVAATGSWTAAALAAPTDVECGEEGKLPGTALRSTGCAAHDGPDDDDEDG